MYNDRGIEILRVNLIRFLEKVVLHFDRFDVGVGMNGVGCKINN